MSETHPHSHLVAKSGLFTGLHAGMGIAAKGMIAAFVIFTVLNVEYAERVQLDTQLDRKRFELVLHHGCYGAAVLLSLLDVFQARQLAAWR